MFSVYDKLLFTNKQVSSLNGSSARSSVVVTAGVEVVRVGAVVPREDPRYTRQGVARVEARRLPQRRVVLHLDLRAFPGQPLRSYTRSISTDPIPRAPAQPNSTCPPGAPTVVL